MLELNCMLIIDRVSQRLGVDQMSVNIVNLWLTHIDKDTGINGIVMVDIDNEYYYLIGVKTCSSNVIELVDEDSINQMNSFKTYDIAVDHLDKSFTTHHQMI